jgi:hypothetical protein
LNKGEFLEAGETQERAAYCMYRAAYQSETTEEFKILLEATSRSYGKASEIYETLEGPQRESRILTNLAMEHFYRSWLIVDSDRKTQVADCVEEFKAALQSCEDVEDDSRYGEVINNFLVILYSLSELSFDYTEGLEIIETSLDYGSKALKMLKKGNDGYELARCYYLLSMFLPDRTMDVIESIERQQELLNLGMSYIKTALELSEKVGDPYLIGLSCGILSYYLFEVKDESEAAMSLARRQKEIGELIGDRLVLARANEYLSYYIDNIGFDEEDRDKFRTAANEAIHHAEESISHYKTILNPILTPFLAHSLSPFSLAIVETDLKLKRKYMIESIGTSHADLEYATESGSLLGQMYLYGNLGGENRYLSELERDEHEKRKLRKESMRYNEKYIDSANQAQPFRYWNIAWVYLDLADLKSQFAKSEEDHEEQADLLIEATEDIDKSIELFNAYFRIYDIARNTDKYARAQKNIGEILFQIFFSSEDKQYLERAVFFLKKPSKHTRNSTSPAK